MPDDPSQWPDGLHIRRGTIGFAVFDGNKPLHSFHDEVAAECALEWWKRHVAGGGAPGELTVPLAQACLNAILLERTAKLSAIEERLAANPLARPGWGARPLPTTLAGRVAAVLRQHYEAGLPRKEIERKLKVGEDQFRFPEPHNLGAFGLTTLKAALTLART
jgi:hypothetical protein